MPNHIPPPPTERGALLSEHVHPRPRVRRLTEKLLALGLGGAVFGAFGLLAVGVAYRMPLLLLALPFFVALSVPLVQLAVMHPHIRVYERGLWLKPLLWPPSWVDWDAIVSVEKHTLIRHGVQKTGQREHFGQLIVVQEGLPWPYRAVAGMAGLGWRTYAFGISTYGHTDYKTLLNAIQHYKGRPSAAPKPPAAR